jgi:hypothetical protein
VPLAGSNYGPDHHGLALACKHLEFKASFKMRNELEMMSAHHLK